VVILDVAIPASGFGTGQMSILRLPFGTTTWLEALVSQFSIADHAKTIVISESLSTNSNGSHSRGRNPSEIHVFRREEVAQWLDTCETADYLLIVDAKYWPVAGYDYGVVLSATRDYRGATHAIAIGQDKMGLRERLECDSQGRVRRVRRLYNVMNWPELSSAPVLWSLVPARRLEAEDLTSLDHLRVRLIQKDVFTHDVPLFSDVFDLSTAEGILQANDQAIGRAVETGAAGYSMKSPGLLVGKGCRVDPSVRFVPPVVLQAGATVEGSCVVIGPTAIGAGAVMREGSSITRSLVGSNEVVPSGKTLSESIVAAGQVLSSARMGPLSDASTPQVAAFTESTFEMAGAGARIWSKKIHLVAKRSLDIIASGIALLILAPLLVVIAILIKIDSRGPVFFNHGRERKAGQAFSCLKFRTMSVNAHQQQRGLYQMNDVDGPQFKLHHDPRVTRVGHWLRRANLDELPQLFNVLVGQMSLVGPRPSPFRENQICVAWRRGRLSVSPGVTGLWQVCRTRRSEGDFHQWIFYDLAYVRNLSFWLDIKILFYTIWSRGGRYAVPLSKLIGGTSRRQNIPPEEIGPCT